MTADTNPSDRAEEDLTAVLYIGLSSSSCGRCRLGADPYATHHVKVLSYSGKGEPCGARFTSMASTYFGTEERLRRMRPDLPLAGQDDPS